MTENDQLILWRACSPDDYDTYMIARMMGCRAKKPPTFTTADDWELVRQSVVVELRGIFHNWLKNVEHPQVSGFEWWLTLSPEECCQLVCNWIKSRPDLFPWVVEMEEGK